MLNITKYYVLVACISGRRVCISAARISTSIYDFTCVRCVHMPMYCIYVGMHMHVCVCVYVLYICMHVCVYKCIYAYVLLVPCCFF